MPKRGYHHGNLRQALVEAALQLIEEKGPTGFTLSEAAKQAGVTPAAVYRHFEGREDLIAEAALAIEMGCDAIDLGHTIHPHPTLSETLNFAAEMFEGTITDLIPTKK